VVSWVMGSKRSEVVFADGNATLMLNSAVGGGLGPHRTSVLAPSNFGAQLSLILTL
jgi:hypothetical protein